MIRGTTYTGASIFKQGAMILIRQLLIFHHMKKFISYIVIVYLVFSAACSQPNTDEKANERARAFKEGEFGYDLQFLKKQDSSLVVLKDGESQILVSPKYQAKVFTSTANGENGQSFGWINYKAFGKQDVHMNAYGGENRLWLGPEGGKFSLFFKPESRMVFENWKTPPPFDTESWSVNTRDSISVSMSKKMSILNYAGKQMELKVVRTVFILGRQEIIRRTGVKESESLKAVGYETDNQLTNIGDREWTASTGMPCIWILDMFKPSLSTFIVVPFKNQGGTDFTKIVTANYFGEIPSNRIKHTDSLLFFIADGKSRGKLGITANSAKKMAGSYDAEHKVLTIISFTVYAGKPYLNQEWNITKPSFSGDAVNAYNDGPLADGTQMGPFYEIESVSPAAFLKPGGLIDHTHTVFHFSGDEKALNEIAISMLGVTLEKVKKSFDAVHN
jgi:hypothetical protein